MRSLPDYHLDALFRAALEEEADALASSAASESQMYERVHRVLARRRTRRQLATLLLAAALATLTAAAIAVGGDRLTPPVTPEPSPEASATPERSPEASATPAPTAEALPSPPSSTPTAMTSAPPTGSPGPVAWRATDTFDASPATSYVTDLAAWSGGFVAIGSAWETEVHVTAEMPALWTSVDGESWEQQPIELGIRDVTLIGVAPRSDGRLLLVGRVPGSGAKPDVSPPRSVAWLSDDAATWEEVALPLSDSAMLASLAHGPKGYVLGAGPASAELAPGADQTPGELWFSEDGIGWTKTYEGAAQVVAGEEGFVAVQSSLAAGPSSVAASADGLTWVPSDPIAAPLLDVAPLGGDWIATGYGGDPATILVFHSTNGLQWQPVLDVNDLTGPDGPKTGRGLDEFAINGASLAGGAGHAFLTLTNNHCCAQMSWNYGVWASSDGASWTPAVEGDALVSSVASAAGTDVLGGHLGRGDAAAFWIGER